MRDVNQHIIKRISLSGTIAVAVLFLSPPVLGQASLPSPATQPAPGGFTLTAPATAPTTANFDLNADGPAGRLLSLFAPFADVASAPSPDGIALFIEGRENFTAFAGAWPGRMNSDANPGRIQAYVSDPTAPVPEPPSVGLYCLWGFLVLLCRVQLSRRV